MKKEECMMHIALIYNGFEDVDSFATVVNPHGIKQMSETVRTVKESLEINGQQVTPVEATYTLLEDIDKIEMPDLIFNISAGITDKRSQANVVGMLEMLGIPMIGSGLNAHVIGLHKEITKTILMAKGVRTTKSQLFIDGNEEIRPDFEFPVIVKPEHEGSSIGVTLSSKVDHPDQLREVILAKMAIHNQVILVEEFLPGREFTVGVMGNLELEVLPIRETVFLEDGPQLRTVDVKAESELPVVIPANITEELKEEIETMVKRTFRLLRCQDFARVDIRLDKEGRPNVIELNTLPGLQKDFSSFPMIAKAAGYSYEELLDRLVNIALEPRGLQ